MNTKYSLNVRDFLKGLLMATMVPALLIIQQSIAAGEITFNWQQIWMAAVGGGIAYLIKNYFTNDVKAAEVTLKKAVQQDAKKQDIPVSEAADKMEADTGIKIDTTKLP